MTRSRKDAAGFQTPLTVVSLFMCAQETKGRDLFGAR
jgi:hypothetical protein